MTVTSSTEDFTSHFHELPEIRCRELLAEHSGGRVAWNSPTGPLIFPVTYAYVTTEVVFRTTPSGALSQLARRTRVAFEIDEIDEERKCGWNVLVQGTAQEVTTRWVLNTLWKQGPVPWAGGARTLFIAVTPERISGRSVQAAL